MFLILKYFFKFFLIILIFLFFIPIGVNISVHFCSDLVCADKSGFGKSCTLGVCLTLLRLKNLERQFWFSHFRPELFSETQTEWRREEGKLEYTNNL